VARLVPGLARKALGANGLALGSLLADWGTLVGPRLAARTAPVKLSFPRGERTGGLLQVRIAGAAALEVQHAEPQILQRINSFFGYAAVARLKLVQGPPPPAPRRPPPVLRALGAAEESRIARALETVEDAGLREALLGLGRCVVQRRGE